MTHPVQSQTEYLKHEILLRRTWSGQTYQLMKNQSAGAYAHSLLNAKAPPLHNGNSLDPEFTQPPPSNNPKHGNALPNGLFIPEIHTRNTNTLKHRIKSKKKRTPIAHVTGRFQVRSATS
jgi:hypothetical protein